LSVDPAKASAALAHPIGTAVKKGETIAGGKSLFGLIRTTVEAPADGVLESVSNVTGQLILREPPIPVEVAAFVSGVVAEVLPEEGVVVLTQGAFAQGIFGVGGETYGAIEIIADSPDQALDPKRI